MKEGGVTEEGVKDIDERERSAEEEKEKEEGLKKEDELEGSAEEAEGLRKE